MLCVEEDGGEGGRLKEKNNNSQMHHYRSQFSALLNKMQSCKHVFISIRRSVRFFHWIQWNYVCKQFTRTRLKCRDSELKKNTGVKLKLCQKFLSHLHRWKLWWKCVVWIMNLNAKKVILPKMLQISTRYWHHVKLLIALGAYGCCCWPL